MSYGVPWKLIVLSYIPAIVSFPTEESQYINSKKKFIDTLYNS